MMSTPYQTYLDLLREVGSLLEQLAALAQQKGDAVRKDDLLALDEVLKQEQALGLNLRGLELRRGKLAPQLGLSGASRLDDLPAKCPPELRQEAKQTVDSVRGSYKIYRSCADMAKSLLELNLHQIEKLVIAAGGDPKDLDTSVGYIQPTVEPPRNMKTDFRA